eukprot:TRINITY_DN43_c0_g1_i5.p1 TRINITY_DN43_c0_g1~~TRINITY_DN43_c0_g1_i5.p1  ORF type:complete len:216 (+),score=10.96 TRINITY_DN43_c0_g1_i5:152-799(+)
MCIRDRYQRRVRGGLDLGTMSGLVKLRNMRPQHAALDPMNVELVYVAPRSPPIRQTPSQKLPVPARRKSTATSHTGSDTRRPIRPSTSSVLGTPIDQRVRARTVQPKRPSAFQAYPGHNPEQTTSSGYGWFYAHFRRDPDSQPLPEPARRRKGVVKLLVNRDRIATRAPRLKPHSKKAHLLIDKDGKMEPEQGYEWHCATPSCSRVVARGSWCQT